jgi:hypothetical protein
MQRDLFLLYDNPFREGDVQSIEMTTHVERGLRQDQMIAAETDHDQYVAGEPVRVRARLMPWRGEEYSRDLELKLPVDLKPGAYIVHLADSSGRQRISQTHRPAVFDPRTFDDVVALLQELDYAGDELRLYLYEPDIAQHVKGASMAGIPSTMEGMIQRTTPPQLLKQAIGRQIGEWTFPMPAPVYGTLSLVIQVVDHFDE